MSLSKILFLISLSFIFGIFFASFFKFSLVFLFLLFPFFFFLPKKEFFVLLLFFLFGVFRFETEFSKIEKEKNLILGEREILGVLVLPPTKKEKFQDLVLKVKEIDGKKVDFSGKVLIKAPKYQDFEFGDELIVFGKFTEPKEIEGFNYKNYLLKDKILAISFFPKVKKTGKNSGSFLFKFLFSLREKLDSSIKNLFFPPHSGLVGALLFGEEREIPKATLEKLNKTNVRHITAVSGMNVTLISILILNFLLALGFSRKHSLYLTSLFLFFYLVMINFPSSAVRAAIMGVLVLMAQYFGRLSSVQRTVFFAMLIMLALNPFLLKYDLGFQLSFLATLGLAYLYPIFLQIFKDAPSTLSFRQSLCATLAAQIFVFPLLVFNFGNFSPIFLFPNVLILPILPLATILAFLSSFLFLFLPSLGKFLSFSVLFFSKYILFVVEIFSKFPSILLPKFSLLFLIFSYFAIFFFTFFLNKKFSQPYFLR